MKSWNKLQILEACNQVVDIMRAEKFGEEYVQAVQCGLDDLVEILEGRLVLPAEFKNPQMILLPGLGFMPLLGQIIPDGEHGNRIEWFGDEHYPIEEAA